mmetsp:Transcript_27852/g.45996  ORF Transcript_27852/g.45996 Transcript_27852/m.45996 type:complete len:83 (+) Transcript_27852:141-389(+)
MSLKKVHKRLRAVMQKKSQVKKLQEMPNSNGLLKHASGHKLRTNPAQQPNTRKSLGPEKSEGQEKVKNFWRRKKKTLFRSQR